MRKPKKQSSKGSMIETGLNVGTGYFLAFGLNLFFLPLFAKEIGEYNVIVALGIGLVYTVVSFIRSLTFRRLFNNYMGKRKWL